MNNLEFSIWKDVKKHMHQDNDEEALECKIMIEKRQRKEEAERKAKKEAWKPRFFVQDATGFWNYHQTE